MRKDGDSRIGILLEKKRHNINMVEKQDYLCDTFLIIVQVALKIIIYQYAHQP